MHNRASKDGACLMGVWVVLGSSKAILGLIAVLAHLGCLQGQPGEVVVCHVML